MHSVTSPRARIEIRELLKELQRLGKTILVSSHILSELGEMCNKLGIIERGKLIVAGTVEELMARARAHPVISVKIVGDPTTARTILESDDVSRREREAAATRTAPVTWKAAADDYRLLARSVMAERAA